MPVGFALTVNAPGIFSSYPKLNVLYSVVYKKIDFGMSLFTNRHRSDGKKWAHQASQAVAMLY
jgi:hypothetical protein